LTKQFEKEKIIRGLTEDKWAFAYDDRKHFLPSNGYILASSKVPLKLILALLNSRLMEFYFTFIGVMTAGGAFTLKHEIIRELPMRIVLNQKLIIYLADKILSITQPSDYLENRGKQAKACLSEPARRQVKEYEQQIDQMVYKLYGLAEEEIKIVEGENNV